MACWDNLDTAFLKVRRQAGTEPFAAETGSVDSLESILEAAYKEANLHANDGSQSLFGHSRIEAAAAFRGFIVTREYEGRSASATRTGNLKHTELLISYGADVDCPNSVLSRTPLLMATYWNRHKIVQLLLAAGAATDIIDGQSLTLLHYAARQEYCEILEKLCEADLSMISPEVRDTSGTSPEDAFESQRPGTLREDMQTFRVARRRLYDMLKKARRSSFARSAGSSDEEIFYDAQQ